jgi:hypothetical protein
MQQVNEFLPSGVGQFFMTQTGAAVIAAALLTWTLIWWRIFRRAGFHGAMGLLMLIPAVNLILLFVLAFGRWPMERELKSLRRVQRAARKAEDRVYTKAA